MKDLNYWKNNAEEDYMTTPISVLRYITELEKFVPIKSERFKVGDKVKITNCVHGHGFEIGEVVEVVNISKCWSCGGVEDILAVDVDGTDWIITEEEGNVVI